MKEFIRLYLSPLLKQSGFRKKGLTWNRIVEGFVHVVDVQKGTPAAGGAVDFTINVGVFSEELWTIYWNKVVPDFVKETDCYPRFRLYYLVSNFDPKRRSRWWEITSEETLHNIGHEVQFALTEKCLPFFDNIKSTEDLLQTSIASKPRMPGEVLAHAILLNFAGLKEESEESIHEILDDPHWGKRAKGISDRLDARIIGK